MKGFGTQGWLNDNTITNITWYMWIKLYCSTEFCNPLKLKDCWCSYVPKLLETAAASSSTILLSVTQVPTYWSLIWWNQPVHCCSLYTVPQSDQVIGNYRACCHQRPPWFLPQKFSAARSISVFAAVIEGILWPIAARMSATCYT